MTYLATAFEFCAPQRQAITLPPPRAPEEVIKLLITEAPEGEHSADAI